MKKLPGFLCATLIAGLVLGCSQQDSGEPVTDETRTASPGAAPARVSASTSVLTRIGLLT